MRAEVCSIHPSIPLILFGGCTVCTRERCRRLSDKIMRELSLVEADGDQDGSPDALGSDSTRLNDQTLVRGIGQPSANDFRALSGSNLARLRGLPVAVSVLRTALLTQKASQFDRAALL